MIIEKFEIEESKVNKGCLILVATAADGKKYVVSGNYHSPTYIVPYENAWDASRMDEKGAVKG